MDFVVYGKDLFWAIEFKNAAQVQPRDLKALKTFGEDYPEAERFLLYRGREKLLRDGITIQPIGKGSSVILSNGSCLANIEKRISM